MDVPAAVRSQDPVVAYKASLLAGLEAASPEAAVLQGRIRSSPIAMSLLRVLEQDSKTLQHTYRKWQGPHWTLTCLAMIDYPPGDQALRPLVTRVHDWQFSRHFLEPPLTATYPGQPDRVRHCASMDGNAIWYSVRLGLEEDRTRDLVDRLIGWQWPDGGWNCDRSPEATHSSFQESLIPARGLWAYGKAHDYAPALAAAQRVAELVLPRRLLWRRNDGSLIAPAWDGRPGPDWIHYPIQFFDVLFALQVMADLGRLADPGCADALALLEAKRLPDGGFPLEAPNAVTSEQLVSRGSYAGWGLSGRRVSNPLVTLAALGVLHAASVGVTPMEWLRRTLRVLKANPSGALLVVQLLGILLYAFVDDTPANSIGRLARRCSGCSSCCWPSASSGPPRPTPGWAC